MSVPAVMRPAITSCAPDHSTKVIAPKNSVIVIPVISACAPMRLRAVSTAVATASAKRPRS
jgi:hypothetical protein